MDQPSGSSKEISVPQKFLGPQKELIFKRINRSNKKEEKGVKKMSIKNQA